MQTVYNKVI